MDSNGQSAFLRKRHINGSVFPPFLFIVWQRAILSIPEPIIWKVSYQKEHREPYWAAAWSYLSTLQWDLWLPVRCMRSLSCFEREVSKMGGNLLINYGEAVAAILFGIGFGNLLLQISNCFTFIINLNALEKGFIWYIISKFGHFNMSKKF